MTLKTPIYMQAASGDTAIEYSAQDFRSFLHGLFRTDGILRPDSAAGGLKVSQRAAGADLSVDVAAGRCIIEGDSVSDQGKYFCWNTDVVNVAMPALPGSGSRTHLVVAQAYDKLHDGSAATYSWNIVVLEDTGSGLPAVPASAIPLASVAVTSTSTSVQNSQITDLRYNTRLVGSQPTQVASDTLRPPAPYASELVWRTDLSCYEVSDATYWYEIPHRDSGGITSGSPWTPWDPVLTGTVSNPALGSGATRQGTYYWLGSMVFVQVAIKFGTSGVSAGSGFYEIELPVWPRVQTVGRRVGSAYAWDDSAQDWADGSVLIDAAANRKVRLSINSLIVKNNVPWTWAANDELGFTICYEALS